MIMCATASVCSAWLRDIDTWVSNFANTFSRCSDIEVGRFDSGTMSGIGIYFHPNGDRYTETYESM